jgi:DNA-binding GntR family transcriptional regulator
MNDSVKRAILSEGAYDAIRRKIITGVFAPSSKLVVATLANGLNLSATPINEALAALEREGLVTYLAHRGYFVSSVTPENVEEVYSVREVFELLAVRIAARKADRGYHVGRAGAPRDERGTAAVVRAAGSRE